MLYLLLKPLQALKTENAMLDSKNPMRNICKHLFYILFLNFIRISLIFKKQPIKIKCFLFFCLCVPMQHLPEISGHLGDFTAPWGRFGDLRYSELDQLRVRETAGSVPGVRLLGGQMGENENQ